jgi:two-component system, LytTR family, response regulator
MVYPFSGTTLRGSGRVGACNMGRGMRIVLFDQDAAIRAKLRATIDEDHSFVLEGESQSWVECETLLDRFVPELLIARVTQLPRQFPENLADSPFPVLVGLRDEADALPTTGELYDTLLLPPEAEHIRRLLARARFEIYRRKADELSSLLERYMAYEANGGQYLSRLRVDDENQTQEIALEHVRFIAADGNYLRVHTGSQTFEIRDTMTGISAKLDPSRFARVHRSFIVNLSHALGLVTKEGSAAAVRLSDGVEVPVGPNYREQVEGVLHLRNQLSA